MKLIKGITNLIRSIWTFCKNHWKLATFFGNILALTILALIIVIALDAPKSGLYFAYTHRNDLTTISSHLQRVYEAKGSTGLQDEENKMLNN